MSVLTIAKSSAKSSVRRRKDRVSNRLVPRALIRFSLLLSIGMAVTTIVLALAGLSTGEYQAIAVVGIVTIATLLGMTLIIASILIVFRCLVLIGERLVGLAWPASRLKPVMPDVATGVTDEWLDGPG